MLKKLMWPTKKEVLKKLQIVLVGITIVSLLLYGADFIFVRLFSKIGVI